jgi:hypothetical protein
VPRNESALDRVIRVVIGIALIAAAFAAAGAFKIVLLTLGAIALFTALTGFCLLYALLGISTSSRKKKDGTDASL